LQYGTVSTKDVARRDPGSSVPPNQYVPRTTKNYKEQDSDFKVEF